MWPRLANSRARALPRPLLTPVIITFLPPLLGPPATTAADVAYLLATPNDAVVIVNRFLGNE